MESTTRKIKWTLKNVTKDKIMQRNTEFLVVSSRFNISIGGTSYEWYLSTKYKDDVLKLFVNFDVSYAKELTINCNLRFGKFRPPSMIIDSTTNMTGFYGRGWNYLATIEDLMNHTNDCVDKKNSLVFNVELTLQKTAKPQQTNIPSAPGETNFAEFLDDDESSDASFTCSDGVKVPVHRLLLIKKSPEFKNIFASMKQQHKTTRKLNNVDSATMKEILKFAYTGNADLKDIQLVKKIYKASVTYDLPGLQIQCVDSLSNQINAETVLNIFDMADEFKLKELIEKCLTQIMKSLHQLMSTQKWKDMRLELKEKVLRGFAGISCSDIELETVI